MNKKIIYIFFLVSVAVFASVQTYAMDYPHNASTSVSCEDCHYIWGSEPSLLIEGLSYGLNIDDTHYNALCWSCHDNITAPLVETHSSLQTDNGYGDWTVECRACHDPHGNNQFRIYGGASYIVQGVVSSVNPTTLTLTGAGWTNDQFQDYVLVPNVAWDYNNYRITGNTSDTLTVAGTIDETRVSSGDTFAIIYGKLIRETISTPSSGTKAVRFFNTTGTNSYSDGDAAYDGVCEVCHTQTTQHRNDVSGDHTHNAGLDCIICHKHTQGFKAACDICHGNPPTVNTSTGGPDGLVNDPGVTGSSTAGAHNVHVNTKSLDCAVCHYNSAGTGATHNNGLTITMGFYLFSGSEQGGAYDGQSGVSYNATTTSPVTSVSSNDNKTCSSIYCHSTGQSTASGSSSTPTYASPVWDDPASGVCGTCHKVSEGAGLTSGSHEAHLGTTGVSGCAECHTGAENDASAYNSGNHINNSIDVANSYDAGGPAGNGYGKCSTGRCHDDGLGNPELTPDWGTPGGGCSECHVDVPATGSHVKHVTTTQYNTADCGDCHNGAVRNTTAPAQHIDGNVDVYDSSAGDLGYGQDVAKGGAPYGSCSTAYCHSTGQSTSDGSSSTPTYATVTWGDTAACGTCHEVVGLTSGSHAEHLGAAGVNGCSDCHTGAADNASAYNSTNHIDSLIDVANTYTAGGAPGNGYGTCSAAACHGSQSPTWGTDFTGVDECTKCHGTATASPAPDYAKAPPKDLAGNTAASDAQVGAHQAHLQSSLSSNVACSQCHTVPSAVSDAEHINDATPGTAELNFGALASNNSASPDYTGGVCSSVYCHGGAMPRGGTDGADETPSWSNTSYLTGSAANDCTRCHGYPPSAIAAHSGQGPTDCITCHNYGINAAGTGFTDASNHINGVLNAQSECLSCHTGVPGGATYVTRDVVGSDFILSSRHVYGGTVTNWDCIVCHREGDATAASSGTVGTTSLHGNDGTPVVDMRNVDSINTGWVWDKNNTNDAMHSNMDTFCMSCHDSDGASGINVKATDDGVHLDSTMALTPFNSTDDVSQGNGGGTANVAGYERTAVLDVYTQFDPTNPSHHAVRGQAYSSHNANWGDTAWVNKSLKNGQSLMTVYEAATLHCADCHTTDLNAHGGSNGFMLQAASIDDTCYLCHNSSTYSDTSSADTRWDHSNDGGVWNAAKGSKLGAYGASAGSICLNCHGGNPATDGFGGIHGLSSGTDPRSSQQRYRFQGGSYMSHDPGSWTGTSGSATCYFAAGTKNQDWSGCTQHQDTDAGRTASPQYSRGVPGDY